MGKRGARVCMKCGKWFMSQARLQHHQNNASRLCSRPGIPSVFSEKLRWEATER